jgi:hypothetical protein
VFKAAVEVKVTSEVKVKAVNVKALSINYNYADLLSSLLTKVLSNKTKTAKIK